jgi:hypothetical protein
MNSRCRLFIRIIGLGEARAEGIAAVLALLTILAAVLVVELLAK